MSLYGGIQLPGHPSPENVRRLDLLPIPMIRRMMRVGVAIDKPWLQDHSLTLANQMDDLRKKISSYVPDDKLDEFVKNAGEDLDFSFNPESSDQTAKLLFEMLGVGYGKKLKRTKGGGRISTGKKELETLKQEHPVIPLILRYREKSKLKGTFCDKLPLRAVRHNGGLCERCGLRHLGDHWRTHCTINTTRTVPGRLSMKDDNLQQIPARTDDGKEVRKGFIASPGCKIVTRDFSQFHLRLLAHLADEKVMQRIFEDPKGDIHVETAMRAFGIDDPKKVDKASQRDPSKTAIFLTIYGGGAATLFETLMLNFALAACSCLGFPVDRGDGRCKVCQKNVDRNPPVWLTMDWCEEFIQKTYGIYPGVPLYFDKQHYRAMRYDITWDPFGRVRRIPEVHSTHDRVIAAGLRQAGNHPIIAFEAGIAKIGMARTEDRVMRPVRSMDVLCEAIIPVHDEIVFDVQEDWADEVGDLVGYEMENTLLDEVTGEYCCKVRILSDGHSMERWEK